MKKLFFLLCFYLGLAFHTWGQVPEKDWDLAKDQSGIQVYTREVAESPYKAFRGIVEIQCSLEDLVKELKDFPSFPKWYYQLEKGEILEHNGPNKGYCYVIIDLPWPVSDRDNIFSYKWERPTPKEAKLISWSTPDYLPLVKDYIRIKVSKSTWHIQQIGSQRVRLTHEAHADPGGKIPAWLANSFVTEAPFSSLKNLRERMENR